jgi:hypothetical protein
VFNGMLVTDVDNAVMSRFEEERAVRALIFSNADMDTF